MSDLVSRYNYDSFVPEQFMPWMRFNESPRVGEKATDFPLWDLEGTESSLGAILKENLYTVVEFGSFT